MAWLPNKHPLNSGPDPPNGDVVKGNPRWPRGEMGMMGFTKLGFHNRSTARYLNLYLYLYLHVFVIAIVPIVALQFLPDF